MSIFEAVGGQAAFLRLAAAHHQRCLDDPVLNHPFSHPGHPRHIERLAAYWAEVFGGPPTYTQQAGGHSAMLELHARTQADADLGTRFVRCFVAACDDAGLPTDTTLRATLRSLHGVGGRGRPELCASRLRCTGRAPGSTLELERA